MIEQLISVERMDHVLALFGNFDANVKLIEEKYGVKIILRGTDIKVTGDSEKVLSAAKAIEALISLLNSGEALTDQNIHYVMDLVEEGQEQRVSQLADDVVCNMFTNSNARKEIALEKEGTQRNITIRGIGSALLDGGKHNGLYEVNGIARSVSKYPDKEISLNCLMYFQNVENLLIALFLRHPVKGGSRKHQVTGIFFKGHFLKFPGDHRKLRKFPELIAAERGKLLSGINCSKSAPFFQNRQRRLPAADADLQRMTVLPDRNIVENRIVQFVRITGPHLFVGLCYRVKRIFQSFDNRHLIASFVFFLKIREFHG